MARSRNIKPGFFHNEDLADIDPLGRLLFVGLWCLADREGRIEDRPRRIKAACLPYDDCDIAELLDALHDSGFITRYVVGGVRCIQIRTWHSHQNPHKKEVASILPPPPGQGPENPGQVPTQTGTSPADSLNLIPLTLREEANASSCGETATPSSPPLADVDAYPCDGKKREWRLTQAKLDEWQAVYPSLDCLLECRKARQWLLDNPARRKTYTGMSRFLGGWLSKAQNKNRGSPQQAGQRQYEPNNLDPFA